MTEASIWHDAHHLKLVLTCCYAVPAEGRAVRLRDNLRKSRRLRRLILKQARSMLQFKIACALSGVKPVGSV
jgi:hypothetical protein